MNDYRCDLYRLTGKKDSKTMIKTFFLQRSYRFMVYYRLAQGNRFQKLIGRIGGYFLHKKMTVEMPYSVKAGKGLLLIHPYSITFNSEAVIGNNFTILKGATIGNVKSGRNPGSPIIGNNVYVGLNSTVLGGGENR